MDELVEIPKKGKGSIGGWNMWNWGCIRIDCCKCGQHEIVYWLSGKSILPGGIISFSFSVICKRCGWKLPVAKLKGFTKNDHDCLTYSPSF